jgi:hypothetical protein
MNKRKQAILVGMILGDAYLQKTGKRNARIRLEHSEKQKDYLLWKGSQFPEFFQGKPRRIERFNPVYKKKYVYFRWQSNASPQIGKFRQIFYQKGKKIIPEELPKFLKDPLSLAIWFMDDGYFYRRDKIAYLYLPKYSQEEVGRLLATLKSNFSLEAKVKSKKRGNLVLIFSVQKTKKLISLIKPFIIPSMKYKISSSDPLSTAA